MNFLSKYAFYIEGFSTKQVRQSRFNLFLNDGLQASVLTNVISEHGGKILMSDSEKIIGCQTLRIIPYDNLWLAPSDLETVTELWLERSLDVGLLFFSFSFP